MTWRIGLHSSAPIVTGNPHFRLLDGLAQELEPTYLTSHLHHHNAKTWVTSGNKQISHRASYGSGVAKNYAKYISYLEMRRQRFDRLSAFKLVDRIA